MVCVHMKEISTTKHKAEFFHINMKCFSFIRGFFLQMTFEAGSIIVSLASNELQIRGSLVSGFLPILSIFEPGNPGSKLYEVGKPHSKQY